MKVGVCDVVGTPRDCVVVSFCAVFTNVNGMVFGIVDESTILHVEGINEAVSGSIPCCAISDGEVKAGDITIDISFSI